MHQHARLLFVALALCSVVPACTSGDDGASTDEADWRSKPTGPDQSGGSLVLLPPPGSPGATAATGEIEMYTTPDRVALGVPVSGLRVGQHSFHFESIGADGAKSYFTGAVNIAAGTHLQVQLGGVRLERKGMPTTLHGRGMPAVEQFKHASSANMTVTDVSIGPGLNGDGTSIVAAVPGDYAIPWGYGDGVVFTVRPNATTFVNAWDYAQRRVVRVVPPTRELPDACSGTYSISAANGNAGESFPSFTEPFEVGQNEVIHQEAYGQPSSSVELGLPCVSTTYTLPLGAKGAGPKVAKLGRLDVDDVAVKMSDGTTQKVRGSYRLFDAQGQSILRQSWYSTNTGLDLPPGTYKLHVDYPQSAGTTGSYEETFTVP